MIDFFHEIGLFWSAVLSGGVTMIIGGWFVWRMTATSVFELYQGTWPEKRHPQIKDRRLTAGGIANWKTGLYGPRSIHRLTVPWMGLHVLRMDDDRAVLRNGSAFFWGHPSLGFYARALIFGFQLGGFITVMGVIILLRDYINFNGGRCPDFVWTGTELKHQAPYLGDGLFAYFKSTYCHITYSIDHNPQDLPLFSVLIDLAANYPQFPAMAIGIPVFLYYALRRPPTSIVFDRRNDIVSTLHNGKLYVARFETLAVTVRAVWLSNTLAMELFTRGPNGEWVPKWFSLATYPYWREWRNDYLVAAGATVYQRWDAQRAWLLRYREHGAGGVHGPIPVRGLMDLYVRRKGTLPGDFDARIRAFLETHGPGPDIENPERSTFGEDIRRLISRKLDPLVLEKALPEKTRLVD